MAHLHAPRIDAERSWASIGNTFTTAINLLEVSNCQLRVLLLSNNSCGTWRCVIILQSGVTWVMQSTNH
ncbi:hypothetical protein OPQ81_004657 [Rhizoctonia solani]|nr:hypothetical protein OPQ81_004657 [Rhizoctonia solani]